MSLKRKRSTSELLSSPSSTTSSLFNFSPPSNNNNNNTAAGLASMDLSFAAAASAPIHLHGRTLKRFRNSRPSDEQVHRKFYEWRAHHQRRSSRDVGSCVAERTLGLLYSAQQQQQQQQLPQQGHDEMALSGQQQMLLDDESAAPATNNQHSLHRFWNINSAPSANMPIPGLNEPATAAAVPSTCDDCGDALPGSGSDGGDGMDLDGCDAACGACGKHVCFSCSVSNLGEERRCLQCAGRRVWVGGIGWANVGVTVC